MKKVSVVISCFNSAKTIPELIERLNVVINDLTDYVFEFVFVDDGSSDETNQLLVQYSKKEKAPFVIIKFEKNYGQIAAILAGLKYASGDASIIMSSDMQDPPELITTFVSEWEKGNDLVGAERIKREDPIIRSVGGWFWYNMVLRKIIPNMPLGGSDYALISKKISDNLVANSANMRFLQAEIIKYAKKITYIPYKRGKIKQNRPSGWSFFKLLGHLLDTSFLHLEMRFPFIVFHCLIAIINGLIFWLHANGNVSFQYWIFCLFTSLILTIFFDTIILLEGLKRIIRSLNTAHLYTIESIVRTDINEK
jgi:glycosyltransferase involved in cell wall biosynthesis